MTVQRFDRKLKFPLCLTAISHICSQPRGLSAYTYVQSVLGIRGTCTPREGTPIQK